MNTTDRTAAATKLRGALNSPSPSSRLQAALTAGTNPAVWYVDALIERCAVEPDFYVRDMLTWALTRHPASYVVPRLVEEVSGEVDQARSQALHTLSKIGDRSAWPAITSTVLRDPHDEVARSAWRAAVVLVPEGGETELAAGLSTQLGRGDRDTRLSLSRALAALGEAALPVLAQAAEHGDDDTRSHALATEQLVRDPDESFDAAIFEAQRMVALNSAPAIRDDDADR